MTLSSIAKMTSSSMMMSDLTHLLQRIQQDCTMDVGTTQSVLPVAGEKLMLAIPLLEILETHSANLDHLVDMLHKDLQELSSRIAESKDWNPLLYLVKARILHDSLERILGRIQFILVSAASVHPNGQVQERLQSFLTKWQILDKKMVHARGLEEQDRQNLVEGDDLIGNLLRFTGNSSQELEEVLKAMKDEQKELQSTAENDLVRQDRGTKEEEEAFLYKIITALESLKEQQRPLDPRDWEESRAWVLCPITKEVMTDPVTVDCKCQHAFGRAGLKEWLDRGNQTCPTCQMRLNSSDILPSPQLRQAIQERISYILPLDGGKGNNSGGNSEPESTTWCGRWCGIVSRWFAQSH